MLGIEKMAPSNTAHPYTFGSFQIAAIRGLESKSPSALRRFNDAIAN